MKEQDKEFNYNFDSSFANAIQQYGVVKKETPKPIEFKSTLKPNYSMTDLQNDAEFNFRANRFLSKIGEDDNIIEYLRDSDYSLTSAMSRAAQVGNWSDEVKQDYVYLRDKYQNADLKGAKEWAGFAKDFAIDMVADPLNIVTALFALPSMGTSVAARTAAGEVVKQGLKKYTASQLTNVGLKAAKRPAIFGAAEGAGWTGAHDYFIQDQDIKLGVQPDNIDLGRLATSTLLGGGIGTFLGGGIGAVGGYKYLNKMQKYANENDIAKTVNNKTVDEIVDEFEVSRAFEVKSPSKPKQFLNKAVAATFGKSTTKFLELAKGSKTLTDLMEKFRYDFGESMFSGDATKVLTQSYGEAKGRRIGFYLARLDRTLNKLYRRGWSGKIDEDDNTALLTIIHNPRAKKFISTKTGESILIPERIKVAGREINELNNKLWDEGFEQGLFKENQKVKNYFPRLFNHSAILNQRGRFENIIIDSGHANPINKVEQRKTTEIVEGVGVLDGLEENLVASDFELFGKDFLADSRKYFEDNNVNNFTGSDGNIYSGQNAILRKAKEDKSKLIVDGMLNQKYQPFELNVGGSTGSSQTYLQSRVFTNIKDKDIADFIETDVETVLRSYYTGASQTITRTQFFGRSIQDFNKKFLRNDDDKTGIYYELKEAGMNESDIAKGIENISLLHRRVTGLDPDNLKFKNNFAAGASSWGRLFQQMAHLPLATISSISEPIILIQRAGLQDSPQAARDLAAALGKNFLREIDRGIKAIKRLGGGKTKGIKDLDDDEWFEIYETGLALEQSVMDRLEGLTGDALTTEASKKFQNAFFKMNLLDQWTRSVQLASFTSGKRAITRNSKKLYEHYSGINELGKSKVKYLEGQLNELGINPIKARTWYKNSLDDNLQFDINKASSLTYNGKQNKAQAAFYKESILGGANRFTKEVILNPSTAEANRPLWFSSPTGQLLMQFAGYPTVFTNTVLKRFVKDMGVIDLAKGDVGRLTAASPRTLGAAMTMTAVAVLGDYIRSKGQSVGQGELEWSELLKGEGLEEVGTQLKRLKRNIPDIASAEDVNYTIEDSEIIFNAIRRWGGFGPFDYAARFATESEYNPNILTSIPKSLLGPSMQDIYDEIRFGSGPFGLASKNLPGISAYDMIFGEGTVDNIKKSGRELDKEYIQTHFKKRDEYATGGEVYDVPRASIEPDERIDKLTGRPYNEQAGTAFQDVEERDYKAIFQDIVNRINS